ncbi:fumarylacetoacetate hydrolase family protein [Glutamicibacter sp.]|uniref:fumarylacetoacetate hydrolase family protein n=1 Tax=Glutamicibacter sp. TaxID=1931995 RepID=UPI002FE112B8
MKLASFEHHGSAHLGIVRNGWVHLLETRLSALEVLGLDLAERNLLEAQAGRRFRAPLQDITLLPPVQPRAMRDFLGFEAHISGMKKGFDGDGSVPDAWYEAPGFLFMNPWSLVGSGAPVPMPPHTQALDFELEVAAIIGRDARDVPVAEAGDYIAGYAIFNDWSARDIQQREMQVGLGPNKGKDFANTLGPWITTPDELEQYRRGDRYELDMTVSINGVQVGQDNLNNLSWSFEEMLAHASRDAMVGAGDVLSTGTCKSGALSEAWSRTGTRSPQPLQIGDTIAMTVTGLGTITNTIFESRSPGHLVPAARRTYSEDQL